MSSRTFPIVSDATGSRSGEHHHHEHSQASSCGSGAINVLAGSETSPSVVAESGFAGNVLMVTLGCAKNLVDSEVMLGALRSRGFRPIGEPEQADLIVVNTCAFLQSAVEEGVDRILELARYKETGRCRKLVVAGCMVERYRSDLESSLPEVDRFISTDELLTVADDESTSEQCFDGARRPYFLYDESMPRMRSTEGHTAFVKIAEGCDRPCAFCIIPKIRGEFRSRAISSIVNEISSLVADGVKEISLVAQDLTSYGVDFVDGKRGAPQLESLLDHIEQIEAPNGLWVRLLYAYPIGVTETLITKIVKSRKICSYLDLPLQHISNSVLKRMNRPLGERGTRGLIEQMATIAPDLAIRTTFVVGFPGETEEDVDALEQFVREGYFTHVGVFTYSQESEAKAFHFPDQVPEEIKEERRRRIMEAQQSVVEARLREYLGHELRVLVDGYHEDTDLLLAARTEWQGAETDGLVIVNEVEEEFLTADGEAFDLERVKGRFGRVLITDVTGYDLVGRLVALED